VRFSCCTQYNSEQEQGLFKFRSRETEREREREREKAVVVENQVLMRPQTEMHLAGNLMLHCVREGRDADKVATFGADSRD